MITFCKNVKSNFDLHNFEPQTPSHDRSYRFDIHKVQSKCKLHKIEPQTHSHGRFYCHRFAIHKRALLCM